MPGGTVIVLLALCISTLCLLRPTEAAHSRTAFSRSSRSASVLDAPDYSLLAKDNVRRFVYVIAFLDKATAETYRNDDNVMRLAVSRVFGAANSFFYQLNLQLVVSGYYVAEEEFPSLTESNKYHNELRKQHLLPYHNMAVFLKSNARYGSSWPGQVCTLYNGVHVGINPLSPEESGSSVFMEFARLANVRADNDTTHERDCRCDSPVARRLDKSECLQIPGYRYNCSVQALFNTIKAMDCLPKRPRTEKDDENDGYVTYIPDGQRGGFKVAVCGNGILEGGEQCDCGFKRHCAGCDSSTCRWKGAKDESHALMDEAVAVCECTWVRKVLEQHCGRQKCMLDVPIWLWHGVVYSVASMLLMAFCCCFSCCFGRSPHKVYRHSVISFDGHPGYKPPPPPLKAKPTIVVLRPTQAPPPPPPIAATATATPIPVKKAPPPPVPPNKPRLTTTTRSRTNLLLQPLPLPVTSSTGKKENPYDRVATSPTALL